jgi:hypothetical protein
MNPEQQQNEVNRRVMNRVTNEFKIELYKQSSLAGITKLPESYNLFTCIINSDNTIDVKFKENSIVPQSVLDTTWEEIKKKIPQITKEEFIGVVREL